MSPRVGNRWMTLAGTAAAVVLLSTACSGAGDPPEEISPAEDVATSGPAVVGTDGDVTGASAADGARASAGADTDSTGEADAAGTDGAPGTQDDPAGAGTDPGAAPPAPAEPDGAAPADVPAPRPPAFYAEDVSLHEDPLDGAALAVTDIEVARESGVDRVTYHLEGQGFPGWDVSYAPAPDTALRVSLLGMREGAAAPPAPETAAQHVDAVTPGSTRGGRYDTLVELRGQPREFRAYLLTEPTRFVLEITDPE